jgi:hypothetical protein
MGRHSLCPEKQELCEEARRIVLWAGSLVNEGEEIGGVGQQLRRAAERLRLHDGVVWRAYQRRSGPEIFPTIWEARNSLIERLTHSATVYPFPQRQPDLSSGYRANAGRPGLHDPRKKRVV